ncbi:MAG: hypothetical protein DRJ35_06480 [Thermoprotei archaeon]|nr:MAG: hypothetical protein DRJ35_06480 [Thermoprotei archaeon]
MTQPTNPKGEKEDNPGIVVIGGNDLSSTRAALHTDRPTSLLLDFASPSIDWEAVIQLLDRRPDLRLVDSVERKVDESLSIADRLMRFAGYRLALPLLDKALAKEPMNVRAYSLKAICLFYLGRLVETVACLDKAVQLAPAMKSETYMLHREALRLQEKYAGNSEGLKLHLACEIQHELARTYKEQGEYEKALACYDRSLAIEPDHSGAWSMKAGLLNSIGRTEEAQACFRKASEVPIDEGSRLHWFNRGVGFLYTNRFGKAMRSFEKALTLDPDYSQAKQNWFSSFGQWMNALPRELTRLQNELETLGEEPQEEPDDVTELVMRGGILMLLDRWAEAAAVFNEASAITDERPVKRLSLFNHIDPFVQWAQMSQITKRMQDLRPFLASTKF